VKKMNNSANKNSSNTSKLVVPGAQQAIDRMKYEIANEFGVNLGPDTASRQNGSVGGEITKRLVQMGESQLGGSSAQSGRQSQ
jgi:small acid-soluble spore protein A (major alpha-type SASP)